MFIPTDVYLVIIDDRVAQYINALREEIYNLATVEIPRTTRVEIEVLGDYLEVIDRSADKRITLSAQMIWLGASAGTILAHSSGFERLIAIPVGKRSPASKGPGHTPWQLSTMVE